MSSRPKVPFAERLDVPFVSKVVVRNYRSIASCAVDLGILTFLIGPNGSGKSNFLDALRFVADATRFSLGQALRERGGIEEVRRRSSGRPNHFGFRLDVELPRARGHFAFNVAARREKGFEIQREECVLFNRDGDHKSYYHVEGGVVLASSLSLPPAAAIDRLYLVAISGEENFRPLYDSISEMGFYNLNPDAIRDLQPPDTGDLLARDGGNITSVLGRISDRSPEVKTRIQEYLAKIVPGIESVQSRTLGTKQTLQFRQVATAPKKYWDFPASSMSDGTLRALGVLVALFQGAGTSVNVRRLVGIEEPEIALHPAAASILMESLVDASRFGQVLVTSHSPDLLDHAAQADESVLAVAYEDGETRIAPLDEAGRSALRDRLYTAGELLRMDQLMPDPRVPNAEQLDLFGLGRPTS